MANILVRDGGDGSTPTTSWAGAYDQITSAEAVAVRGDTIWVAGGTYSAVNCNVAPSSTTLITIKRATIASHGVATGWSDAYDSQATVASFDFDSSYWVLDGVTGDGFSVLPADTTASNYGFYISGNSAITGGSAADATNVTVRHCYMLGPPGAETKWAIYFDTFVNSVNNWTISHCYMDRWGNAVACGGGGPVSGMVFEYNVCTRGYSTDPGFHGEWINASSAVISGMIIRWCLFKDMEEGAMTGAIVGNNENFEDGEIYGCVFHNMDIGSNGLITGTSVASLLNTVIYNNTFIANEGGPWVGAGSSSTGQIAKNNLIYNQDAARSVTTGDYNYYIDTTNTPAESNDQLGTGDPFVNLAGGDYRLDVDSDPGDTGIAAGYRTDALGNTGSTRGAFQFEDAPATGGTSVVGNVRFIGKVKAV